MTYTPKYPQLNFSNYYGQLRPQPQNRDEEILMSASCSEQLKQMSRPPYEVAADILARMLFGEQE